MVNLHNLIMDKVIFHKVTKYFFNVDYKFGAVKSKYCPIIRVDYTISKLANYNLKSHP